jgi:hypothetical protein
MTPPPTPRLIPQRPRTLGLTPHPAPRHLHGHGSPIAMTRLRDPACSGGLATLVRCRREAGPRPDWLGRPPVAPSQAVPAKPPRTLHPHPPSGRQRADPLHDRLRTRASDRPPLRLQAHARFREALDLRPFTLHTGPQGRRPWRAIPWAGLSTRGLHLPLEP